jgi:dCTP deaminase
MILTGAAIASALKRGSILIDPFDPSAINPNSYNFRLGNSLIQFSARSTSTDQLKLQIPPEGFVLQPNNLYLGSTLERAGSSEYVMTLLGRSSLGRLGVFLNITADLGHVGAPTQWTLELTVVQPLRIYAGMRIGQFAFWIPYGHTQNYGGLYSNQQGPVQCQDSTLLAVNQRFAVQQL